jgi:uncharacterized protein (TIGR00725 family)
MQPEAFRPYIAVIGGGDASDTHRAWARDVGRVLAESGAVVVCGGLGGVMEAACAGAHAGGGMTVGILPGDDRGAANPHVDVAVPTGLGEARNAIVVCAADVVVAVGGGYGTLSEIALALRAGTPVIGLDTWELQPPASGRTGTGTSPIGGVVIAADPADAARQATVIARARHDGT